MKNTNRLTINHALTLPHSLQRSHVSTKMWIVSDISHATPQRPVLHVLAVKDDLANQRLPESGHQVQDSGALLFGGCHDSHHLAAANLEGDVVDEQVLLGGERGARAGPEADAADL